MAKVEVYYRESGSEPGVSLRIRDKGATVGDLLEAWQPLCDDDTLFKAFAAGNYSMCKGCTTNCCNTAYVIPDIISFKKMAHDLQLSHDQFLLNYFQDEKLAVGLPRMKPDPCIFLRDNICTIYPLRSLICRFYVCARLTGVVEQFIYSLTWTGITAAILFMEENGLLQSRPGVGMSSLDILFKGLIEEYRYNPNVELFMNAKEYFEIPLLPFIDSYTRELICFND